MADMFSNKMTQASPKKQCLTPSQKIQFQGSAKKVVPIRDLAADAKVSIYASYLFFQICELIFETVVKAKLSSMILTVVKTLQMFSSKHCYFGTAKQLLTIILEMSLGPSLSLR